MANEPAKAGSSRGPAPGNPPLGPAVPRGRRGRPGHDPAREDPAREDPAREDPAREDPEPGGLAWIAYLIVLAGVAAGMYVAWQGSRYAGRGAGLVGCSLLAAGLARLFLPPRYAGLLASRRKASDVLAFTAFGVGVLALALMLP